MSTSAVTVERSGPVTTVRLSGPHARNAVDPDPLIDGGTVRLPWTVGTGRALDLLPGRHGEGV